MQNKSGTHAATCGLYYKHVTIVNYTSSSVNKLKASLNDDARVVIYDRHMFIVQATGHFHSLFGSQGVLNKDPTVWLGSR